MEAFSVNCNPLEKRDGIVATEVKVTHLLKMVSRSSLVVLVALLGLSVASGCSTPRTVKRTMPLPAGQNVSDPPSSSLRKLPVGHGYLHLRDSDGTIREIAWEKQSKSVGRPNDGELEGGIEFPQEGPAWRRKKGFAYGTDETVRILVWAFEGVARQFPGTVPVVVGDISDEDGGKLKRHKSHQSGRDADIGYFARDNRALRYFEKMSEQTLDAEKTWALVEAFIMTGYTQYIFMSYKIIYQAANTTCSSGLWGMRSNGHIPAFAF